MKIVKWVAVGIAAVVVLAIVVAFLMPRHITVARSVEIAAPASAIFPLVSDLRRFNEWSPWADIDPATVYTFTGPTDGVGQTFHWRSGNPGVGSGSMSILAVDPDKRVDISVDFADQGTATTDFVLETSGGGTRVTWGFDTDLGFDPIARYFGGASTTSSVPTTRRASPD